MEKNEKQRKKRKEKSVKKSGLLRGSAVIEASMIVPFILLIFVLLIQVSFFLYQECTAWQHCYIAALRADTVTGKKERKETLAGEFAQQLFREGMLELQGLSISQKTEGERLTVYGKGNTKSGTENAGVPSFWHFEAKGEVTMLRPAAFIRQVQTVREIAGKKEGENGR